ncbi:glycosyltransferase family 2 protein [Streptomyces pactum]|uniref:glycosyltransferase family 2 protein n=1 Tax=Streptomyces pactum TaxID=68249 RepID=UPI003700CE69
MEATPARPGGGPGDISVSVVVPTRDRTTRLLLTLAALAHQTLDRDRFEVILVDDAPERGAVDRVLAAAPGTPPLRHARTGGRGPARARNAGAELARGELLLFLDDDTVATPELLTAHLAAHRDAPGTVVHGTITDLSAFALTPDPPAPRPALTGARGRSIDARRVARLREDAQLLGPRRSFIERTAAKVIRDPALAGLRWLACIGTSTSVRRADFERAGGFDEGFGELWGGEDLELGLRLHAAGARFALLDTVAYHLPTARRDTGELLPRFWRLAAERHGDPRLADVGPFLAGRLSPEELAARLGTRTAALSPGRATP